MGHVMGYGLWVMGHVMGHGLWAMSWGTGYGSWGMSWVTGYGACGQAHIVCSLRHDRPHRTLQHVLSVPACLCLSWITDVLRSTNFAVDIIALRIITLHPLPHQSSACTHCSICDNCLVRSFAARAVTKRRSFCPMPILSASFGTTQLAVGFLIGDAGTALEIVGDDPPWP